ncbi:hypothetical protein [Apocheima cinerarium nucleopolyhedrovirus]|uniref:hypothetical protein n=1 Tax=Apocheima cinerarium nucleopolyhedrovirus TaxID=307461 RepID=UPI0001D9203D|nr:hypothetical protein [Apocheima cinerarium nucleopolyhedrovirus]ADB84369.1 hypothetical protein [Apocheima cinerarium nucleopolyhedrovirus]
MEIDHPLLVYLNKIKTNPSIVYSQNDNKRVKMKYILDKNCMKDKILTINVNSNNKYIQTTFVCPPKYLCVVNANNKTNPCYFDGFASEEDEFKTKPFVVRRLNPLMEEHGLNVIEMAQTMEKTVFTIFINEAIICNDYKSKWYYGMWFNDFLAHDDAADDDCNETYLTSKVRRCIDESKTVHSFAKDDAQLSNFTTWAPVECKTGPLLLVIDLIFVYG